MTGREDKSGVFILFDGVSYGHHGDPKMADAQCLMSHVEHKKMLLPSVVKYRCVCDDEINMYEHSECQVQKGCRPR